MNFVLFRLFPPDLSYIPNVLSPLLDTIRMSLAGTGLGILLALIYGCLCTSFLNKFRFLRVIMRTLIQIIRAIPVLILALASAFLFGTGVQAGTVALTVYTFAVISRLTYEDVDKASVFESETFKAFNACYLSGVGRYKSFVRCVWPHVSSGFIENSLYLLEANARHASILGYVGAGGIGLILDEKLSWRQYSKAGTIILLLYVMVLFMEYASILFRKSSVRSKKIWISVFVLLTALSLFSIPLPKITASGKIIFLGLCKGFLHPDLGLFNLCKTGIPFLLLQTVLIAALGAVLGTIPALLIAIIQHFSPKPTSFVASLFVCALRTIPFFVYAVTFIRIFGPGFTTGIFTMASLSIGLLTKRISVILKEMKTGPWQALKASGTGFFASFRYAILPQIWPRIKKVILYRFDINLRDASVLGFAGAGGIGAPLIFAMNAYKWDQAASIILSLMIFIILIDLTDI